MCGNGASEIFMAMAHAIKPETVLIVAPSFSGYVWAFEAVDAKIIYYVTKDEDDFSVKDDIVNIIEIDNWNGRYFLSGPVCYNRPEFNYSNGEKSHMCNHDEVIFSNKEAVIDYIKDTTKKLKDTKVHLRKLKLK